MGKEFDKKTKKCNNYAIKVSYVLINGKRKEELK